MLFSKSHVQAYRHRPRGYRNLRYRSVRQIRHGGASGNPDWNNRVDLFFNLKLTYNTGVSFGLFSDTIVSAPRLFATLQGGIVVGLVIWAVFANSVLEGMAITAMAGGASGNVVDRLMNLRVTDYLDFHASGWSWPAFNIADVFIVCGAIVLVAASVVQTKNEHASTNS